MYIRYTSVRLVINVSIEQNITLKPMLVIKFYICMCMYMLLARSELLNRVFFLFLFFYPSKLYLL